MPRHVLLPTFALALCACLHFDARAERIFVNSGAADHCRPALPAFDGLIRTRPLAMQNEGDAGAFVTCSIPAQVGGSGNRANVIAFFVFRDAAAAGPDSVDVTCTAVGSTGVDGPVATETVAVSTALSRGEQRAIGWTASRFSHGRLPPALSFSCLLPPGIGLGNLRQVLEDGT